MNHKKEIYAGILMICLVIACLNYYFHTQNSEMIQPAKEAWKKYENLADVNEQYFINASEWHYKEEFEKKAACAVENYSGQTETEEWELIHMYSEGGKISVFVRSKSYRELFLLLENDMWTLVADIQKGNTLEVELMGGEWSYQSDLVWHSYSSWIEGEEAGSYQIDLNHEYYQYDSVYEWQTICAFQSCLELIKAKKNTLWEISYENYFISSQGSLVDVWCTDGRKKVHIVIDIGNKLYTIIDVI